MRTLLAVLLCCLSFAVWAQAPDFSPVTQRVERLVIDARLPGASVLIVRDGEVLYERAFGAYTLGQRVAIASASKWVTGAVIARLVDQGLMRWDDRIERYLPDAPVDKRIITLRQLYSHSSGLPGSETGCIGDPDQLLADCVTQILALPLAYPPGQGFAYGGLSMQVAGRLAEIATGKRFEQIFFDELATPLGLTATDFGFTRTTPGLVSVSNPRIAGGLRSTLGDYGRFLSAIQQRGLPAGGSWLAPAVIDQMAEDQTRAAPVLSTPFEEALGYGIGQWLERRDADGAPLATSSPGAFGFYPYIDREAGFAGVFLTQNLLRNVETEVRALWGDVRTILLAEGRAPRIAVQAGHGSGNPVAGATIDVYAEAPGERIFAGWRGDAPVLADPRAWHAPFSAPGRALSLGAEFILAPAIAPETLTINGARYRQQMPQNPRAVVFAFHGSGGSGDLPFTRVEALISTRLWLAAGFGVIGLDSVDRVNRQWNPQYALANPDVVNVTGILERLRAEGRIGTGTPIFCEGTSNGGGFCSRISALLGFAGQSLMIADGIEAIMAQTTVPTIWTLGRNDPTLAPGYLERSQASFDGLQARGIAAERHVIEPSTVYPERFTRIPGISLSDSRALVDGLRSGGFLDASGYVIRDPRGNALTTLLPAALRPLQGEIVGQMENAAGAHQYFSDAAHRVVHFFEAQLARNLTGLWWQPAEPGWGLSLAHQGDALFPTWYTYDAGGRPVWYVGGALTPGADGRYRGPAYRVSGRPFSQIAGAVDPVAEEVGEFSLRPNADGRAEFVYTIGSVTQQKYIERTRFGRVPNCRFTAASRAQAANRSDIWWNPLEPGWGLYLWEQDETLVVVWYTYASDGAPMWLLGALARDAEGRFRGTLTRPVSGIPFDRISGAATSFPVPTVGTMAVEFVDGQRALVRTTLDGVAQVKDIERFVYAGPGLSECQ
jgi:CubicO group peptidase (beta-lactamase class C family)